MGANDASGQGLQSALKNKQQNNFLRNLQAVEVRYLLFSIFNENNKTVLGDFN
jgi:hypothetical protein